MKISTRNRIDTLMRKLDELITHLDEREPNSRYLIEALEEARAIISDGQYTHTLDP